MRARRKGWSLAAGLVVIVLLVVWIARGPGDRAGAPRMDSAGSPAPAARNLPASDVADLVPLDVATAAEDLAGVPAEAAESVAPGTGRLVVRLTWESDGTPAADVGARAIFWDSPEPRLHPRLGVTDAQGAWVVGDAPLGRVTIYLDRANGGNGEVRVGETTELEFALPPGVLVRGMVLDPAGRAVPAAGITLAHGSSSDPQLVARTDDAGRFELRDVGSSCYVGAVAQGHLPSLQVSVGAGHEGVHDVTLEVGWSGARIVGRVVDVEARPISGALVFIGPDQGWPVPEAQHNPRIEGPPQRRALTDDAGAFEVLDLPRGHTPLGARAAGFSPARHVVDLQPEATATVEIVLPAAAIVEGVVTDARGQAVAGASVATETWEDIAWVTTRSGPDGQFELVGVMPGDVDLTAQKEGLGKAETEVEVLAGRRARWEAQLTLGLQIVGRVVDSSGAPLPGLHVQAFHQASATTTADETDELGRFRLDNCGDGEQALSVFDWALGARVARMEGVRPGPDEVLVRVLPLGVASAWLTGRVVDGEGRVAELVSVLAVDPASRAGDTYHADSVTGLFRCGPLIAGEWQLHVMSKGRTNFEAGQFTLAAGETRDVGDIVLPASARVVLRVRLDSGITTDRVYCQIRGPEDRIGPAMHLEEGLDPVWVSPPLEPGDYVVTLGGSSGGPEDAFVLPARAEVYAVAGGDTHVELFAERGIAQNIHVTTLRAPPPQTTVIVTDAAGLEVERRSVHWNDPRPGKSEHEGWVSFIARPGGYTARIECEDGYSDDRGISVAGGANIAPEVEVSLP